MSLNNLAWQNRVASVPIVKARNKIVLPAFNVFDYADVCYACVENGWSGTITAAVSPTTGYTMEAWIKVEEGQYTSALNYILYFNDLHVLNIRPDFTVRCKFTNAATAVYTLTTALKVSRNAWTHIAFTWDNTDNLMRCYINGVLDVNTTATVGDAATGVGGSLLVHRQEDSPRTKINEVRFWNYKRSEHEIQTRMFTPRQSDAGLLAYWKFDEGDGYTIDNAITGNPLTLTLDDQSDVNSAWIDDDSYPRRYGANWVVAKFHTTMTKVSGFRMPITLPADANFALCVIAITGVGTLTRYVLANPLGIKLPDSTITYTGQRLPTTFTLEIWHKDGEVNTLLSDAVNLQTSTLRVVTTTDYGTLNADTTIVIDEDIYTPFPFAFPLTFDQPR